MREKLTPKQLEIYAYIAGYITDNVYSPTYYEISLKIGSSIQSIDAQVKNIIKKGWIKFNGKKHRKLELIPKQ